MGDIFLTIDSKAILYPSGITGIDLVKKLNKENVMYLKVNNKYQSLDKEIIKDSKVEFIDYANTYGRKVYINGLKFIYIIAVKAVLGKNSNVVFVHSIDKGIYTKIVSEKEITSDVINNVKLKIKEIIEKDFLFETFGILKKELSDYYEKTNQLDKRNNLRIMTNEYATINKCYNEYAYFFGKLPISTSYIKSFDLTYLEDNKVILRFPVTRGDNGIPEYIHHEKMLDAIERYDLWIKELGTSNVAKLNEVVYTGGIKEFILMNELNQNKRLIDLAGKIYETKDSAKIVLLAGPSSSGKTTTSNKLRIYLKELGLNPHVLSTDDYFIDKELTPLDEFGEPDLESIDSIDIELFNSQLNNLINGNEVDIPEFNFVTGKKEYKGRKLRLKKEDILIIEGLHTLNEKLTKDIERKNKLKIYVSPLTPLSIDTYNNISSTDLRLLRRLLRDYRTRGNSIEDTLSSWGKVRKGEEKYIFPHQDEADIIFNTAFIYEISVIKVYIEPLLYIVPSDSVYYEEARRLLKFLSNFLTIPSEYVPKDSILREFIGGSCFYE